MSESDSDSSPRTNSILTVAEFDTLLRLAKRVLWSDVATRRALQQQKINIIPCNFYSDVPAIDEIEKSFEQNHIAGAYNAPAIFNNEVISGFLGQIDNYADEFVPSNDGRSEDPQQFFWKNPAFSWSDAMAYYCVLRHFHPRRVIEVGSGFSTLVALQALEKNGVGTLVAVEPFPKPWLAALSGRITLYQQPVQSLEAEFFNDLLDDGDILFIDSTHTVKAGSDCLHLYLRILPQLTSNVLVHAHDIYLPFPLPTDHAISKHVYWTEQYLLYAYLLDNPRTQVLFGSHYNFRFNRTQLETFMRGRYWAGGASLWFSLQRLPEANPIHWTGKGVS